MAEPIRSSGTARIPKKAKRRRGDGEYARRLALFEERRALPPSEPMKATTLSSPFGTRQASYRSKVARSAALRRAQ